MADFKFITDHTYACQNLYEDVGKNNVRCYDIANFPGSGLSGCYPQAYLDKCASVTVAISGDAHGQDWMAIIPYRVDHSGRAGQKVYDIDPFIVTFDANTNVPALTGMIGYHQNFEGRTTLISGYDHFTKPQAVAALRQQLDEAQYPISGASPEVATALGHMVDVFRHTF